MAGLLAVILLYAGSALVVPIHQDFPIVDEPIYAEPAFEYARTGVIRISEFAAPNAVVETVVGGLVARALGEDLGVLRLSAMAITALSAPFMYVLCRALGATRHMSVLGVSIYLFTPLAFTITHVFHTDPFATALVVISAGSLAATLAGWERPMTWLWTGSMAMAMGFLSRPQMLVLPAVAVFVWLRWGDKASRWKVLLVLAGPTLIVVAAHSIWTQSVGEPFIRGLARQDLIERGARDVLKVISETLLTTGIYIGLFVLPLAPLHSVRWRGLLTGGSRRVAIYTAATLLSMAVAMAVAGIGPFNLQTWISNAGLGGVDGSQLGSRPELPFALLALLTAVLYASAYLLAMKTVQKKDCFDKQPGLRLAMILSAGFAFAVAISSIPLHAHVLDRYWLPIVPLSVAIGVSLSAPTRPRVGIAWMLTGILALVSLAGTYDSYVVYREVNEYAADLLSNGLDRLSLDAGASWAGAEFGLQDDDPVKAFSRKGPFWVRFYAVDSNPTMAIALSPISGFDVVERRSYRSLLHPEPQYLYLLRPSAISSTTPRGSLMREATPTSEGPRNLVKSCRRNPMRTI